MSVKSRDSLKSYIPWTSAPKGDSCRRGSLEATPRPPSRHQVFESFEEVIGMESWPLERCLPQPEQLPGEPFRGVPSEALTIWPSSVGVGVRSRSGVKRWQVERPLPPKYPSLGKCAAGNMATWQRQSSSWESEPPRAAERATDGTVLGADMP